MPSKQNDREAIDGAASDPSAEEVGDLRQSLDEAKATERVDVLEDMLDIMNER